MDQSTQLNDDRLMLLLRLSNDVNISLNPDEVLEHMMDEVISITRAERGFVMFKTDLPGRDRFKSLTRGIKAGALDTQEFDYPKSIVKQVIETGEPILTSDALTDKRFNSRSSVIIQKLRSILCVPLRTKSEIFGALYVDSRIKQGVFRQIDLDLLTAIAANAAIAMDNARLYRDTESKLQTLDLLHKISQEITSTLDLDHVLTVTTRAVKDLLNASAASIMTVADSGDALIFQVAVGETSSAVKPFRIPLDRGIAGWVVTNKEPLLVNDVRKDSRFYGTLDKKTGFSTDSVIAVPLIVNENAIGVIEVFNKPGGFTQDDLELLATFASSATFAIENARLYRVAVDKGRLERELQVARQVQADLLPQTTPKIPGWEIAARWLPAREVAGDYYDFVPLEKDQDKATQFGIVIGDVADKGMPAALFMVDVRSTLRASMYSASKPSHGISHSNELISADSPNGMFVTLFYAQVNTGTSEVTYVNCGHNPPYLVRHNGTAPELLTRTGMALGIDSGQSYDQRTVLLEPGDFIVFYTDGVTDALSPDMKDFGEDQLQKVILAHRTGSAEQVVTALEEALTKHIGKSEPFDDITILVLARTTERS